MPATKSKIYVASSSRAVFEAKSLASVLEAWGYETIHSWTEWTEETLPEPQGIWEKCFEEIHSCDFVIVLVPATAPLCGAIYEAGFAAALGKMVIVHDPYLRQIGDWHKSSASMYCNTPEMLKTFCQLVEMGQYGRPV